MIQLLHNFETRGRHVRNPGTHPNFKNMGSGGIRVPGKLGQSGFRWVPGSRWEPRKVGPGQIGPNWLRSQY